MNRCAPGSSTCCRSGALKLCGPALFKYLWPLALPGLLFTAGCKPKTQEPTETALCTAPGHSISAIQGTGERSALTGHTTSVRGIVTRLEAGRGLWLQEAGREPPGAASRALFIADDDLAKVAQPGSEMLLHGRVAELGDSPDTLTALVGLSAHEVCGTAAELPLTSVTLPMVAEQREAVEGMRAEFSQRLTVSDVYYLYNGGLTLSSGGVLRVPTEIAEPGAAARQIAAQNEARSIRSELGNPSQGGRDRTVPVGSTLAGATGLFGHQRGEQRFLLDPPVAFETPSVADLAAPAAGQLRIVSLNLLNYFNGDGQGGGFPTARGAKTPREFQEQKRRIGAALAKMQPQLLAVQELENDGFGPDSAARSLLGVLNESVGDDWAVIEVAEGIGRDLITVGLFYRARLIEPVGKARVLEGPEFRRLNRVPLAQRFRHRDSGREFLLAVNHLKSKGGCPNGGENADQRDGQACWNAARGNAVRALLPWLQQLARDMGTENLLIVGDMNSWRREDPVDIFRQAGYQDLAEELSGRPQHSFRYWGQLGTLDYAFASAALAVHAIAAQNWPANTVWPRRMTPPKPWLRVSDHDPVIVDFAFSQSATSN